MYVWLPPLQTNHPNIYAAGDCIGYPALASTSMEQGQHHHHDEEATRACRPRAMMGLTRLACCCLWLCAVLWSVVIRPPLVVPHVGR